MNSKNIFISVSLIAAFALLGIVVADVLVSYLYPTVGVISSISLKVTWLDGTPVTTIDWGPVKNDTSYTYEPFNITNMGNVPITLTLSTEDWSSSIKTLMLTWNYTVDTILEPTKTISVELTQTIKAYQTFSYNTVITATEKT